MTIQIDQLEQIKTQLQHAESAIERAARSAFMEWGAQLKFIRDNGLYIVHGGNGRCTWESYAQDRWEMSPQRAHQIITSFDRVKEIERIFDNSSKILDLPSKESHVLPLAKLETVEQRAEVWGRVVEATNGSGITAKTVEAEVERYKAELEKNWYTLEQWNDLPEAQRQRLLSHKYAGKHFNKQESDNIEWARWSWNPITGCLHNCAYCYARDIASRFYPQKFDPTIIPERLSMPANTPRPDLGKFSNPVDQMGYRNVFTCSMADLFGKWVPTEWIEAVLRQAWDNPQWNFLFLTKFPIRMAEFEYPPNTWIGTTVDTQYAVERAEKAFRKVRASGYEGIAWLSCEPMMERLNFSSLEMFDWVVVGGASRSTQTPEFRPPFEWIVHLWNQAKSLDLPVYMKTNLFLDDAHKGIDVPNRVREYPVKVLK